MGPKNVTNVTFGSGAWGMGHDALGLGLLSPLCPVTCGPVMALSHLSTPIVTFVTFFGPLPFVWSYVEKEEILPWPDSFIIN